MEYQQPIDTNESGIIVLSRSEAFENKGASAKLKPDLVQWLDSVCAVMRRELDDWDDLRSKETVLSVTWAAPEEVNGELSAERLASLPVRAA